MSIKTFFSKENLFYNDYSWSNKDYDDTKFDKQNGFQVLNMINEMLSNLAGKMIESGQKFEMVIRNSDYTDPKVVKNLIISQGLSKSEIDWLEN